MINRTFFLGAAAAASLLVGSVAAGNPQDPSKGGQLNRCWGSIASQVAQLDTSNVDANGGGMGVHSRAAAGQGSTFGDNVPFGTPFNSLNAEGNHGRTGVGNVSAGAPHNTHPGDGGNGQHAINNSNSDDGLGFSNLIDPLTGFFGSAVDSLFCQ
jgi:hypothetical protein